MKHKDAALIATIEAMQVASATFSIVNVNKYRYVAAESFYKLVMAFSPVPDLHIMWLLHICEARQEMQSWVEAAQCVVTIAGIVMQVASFGGSNINLSAWEDKKNPSESKDGFLMDWDDVVERMKMDVCNERGGGNELETFCAKHLGFR
ncbi:hypothetical protein BC332_26038 [Capsicum chinense]|nr:hypothetical protein BC332_26038 [Capsicum chinense]